MSTNRQHWRGYKNYISEMGWASTLLISGLLAGITALLVFVMCTTAPGDAVVGWVQRARHQKRTYQAASRLAKQKGKKLVVIGDPRAKHTLNALLPMYDCGDCCIDLAGCSKCDKKTVVMAEDVLQALKKLPDNSAVIYESEVLEYVDYDIVPVIEEMKRVSGGDMFATHFTGVRTRLLTKSARERWMPKRIMVQFPPHSVEYRWIPVSGIASWQSSSP